jgi:hypothetical protein
MSRSSRRYKPLQVNHGGGPISGCDRIRMPRARVLIFCLIAVLMLAVILGICLSYETSGDHSNRLPAVDLAKDRVKYLSETRTHTQEHCSVCILMSNRVMIQFNMIQNS